MLLNGLIKVSASTLLTGSICCILLGDLLAAKNGLSEMKYYINIKDELLLRLNFNKINISIFIREKRREEGRIHGSQTVKADST